ncbi:FGGY family carbohydrate kinase [Microbacter sp. GSS18]|nr:FGGY family carbohydrate kinase [Microbacter sp. GSS18]
MALGVDAGSHGVRVVLRDGATELARASADYAGPPPPARRPLPVFLDALRDALADVPAGVRDRVAAVSITGVRGALVGLDAADRVVTDVIPDFDAATLAEARRLARDHGDELVARTGCPAFPLSGMPKLIALHGSAHRWTGLPDALTAALGGTPALSRGIAVRLGVMRADASAVDAALLHEYGIDPRRLAPLAEVGAVAGRMTPYAAARLGLTRGAALIVAPGDGPSALSAAQARYGTAIGMISLGTTTVVSAPAAAGIAGALPADVTYELLRGDGPTAERTVETGDGSGMFQVDWAARVLGCAPAELDAIAAGVSRDDARPDLLPVNDIWGERTRSGHDDPVADGIPAPVVAATALHVVADGAVRSLRRLADVTPITRVVVTGGGCGSAVVRERLAADTGVALTVLPDAQLAAEGAARAAGTHLEGLVAA